MPSVAFPNRIQPSKLDSFRRAKYSNKFMRDFLPKLLLPRLIEERMLLALRQGRVSKWFAGIGQEAIAVGATAAMTENEFILPLHRNLGVFTTRGVPLPKLIAQFQGSAEGFTKGRDRSFHFGAPEHNIIGMISHLGPQLAVADGVALAHKLKRENAATLVFCGDGCTSEGDFHEALNVAAVWQLPVIFLLENNGYGLSTPVSEQYACEFLSDRAPGYGMEGVTIDGNDLLEVYETVNYYATRMRKRPEPVLIECLTFRRRGHEEASGTKYVPEELMAYWEKRDPVARFERELVSSKALKRSELNTIKEELLEQIKEEIEEGFTAAPVASSPEQEEQDVYSSAVPELLVRSNGAMREMRFVDAISDALRQSMERYDQLVLMGQDIADYGGVFKITEGFTELFGEDRVRNTPLCESAILGAGLGLAAKGFKSVVEMQFSDFVSSGYTQIINNLAKVHYRWGMEANTVVRMPCGAGVGAGPFHSQSTEAWFLHTPGLKIAYPAFPSDAKGLLMRSISDPNPVMFFEHKALYRSIKEEVPENPFEIEFGKASRRRDGERFCIVTYGAGVHWALALAEKRPELDPLILDLRTLNPIDWESIEEAVQQTSRVLVLHEANLTAGVGAEIAAMISEKYFMSLDAPVMRCAGLDTPVPFGKALEADFLASSRLELVSEQLLAF